MERAVSRRQFVRDGMAFSLVAPSLLSNLFPYDHTKMVLDIAGYNLPSVTSHKEALAIREFKMLRGESAVVVNPPLSLVSEFRKMNKLIIVRPYFEHNNYNPAILERFLNYPPGTIWLPFVEPNVVEDLSIKDESGQCKPKVVGKIVHDPQEIINEHFLPFAQAVLARPFGENDIVLIPPTAQWASEDEFDFPHLMYRSIKKSNVPLKNLGVAVHDYQRQGEKWSPWFRLTTLVKISTVVFEDLLPFFVTEAGPFQDENSLFTEREKAEVTEKTLVTAIDEPLLKEALVTYDFWNQGYKRYAHPIMNDPNGCHSRVVTWFEKAAIIGENGPTETFHRIRDLTRRRAAELGRVALQAI